MSESRIAPTLLVVRPGREGRYAALFRRDNLVGLEGGPIGSVLGLGTEEITRRLSPAGRIPERMVRLAAMLQRFASEVQPGDVAIAPDTRTRVFLVGVISGAYEYRERPPSGGPHHIRPV